MDAEQEGTAHNVVIEDAEDECETTLLTNIPIEDEVSPHNVTAKHLAVITNSDGNLTIDTIEEVEEEQFQNETVPQETFVEDVKYDDDTDDEIDEMDQDVDDSMEEEEEEYIERKVKILPIEDENEANPCTICQRNFKTSASLKRHITVCHPIEQRDQEDQLTFQLCHCCGEPLDSAHTVGDFKCSVCDKLFILQNSLDRHQSIEHSDGVRWTCIECEQHFEQKDDLANHMYSHPIYKPISCKFCNREFTRKYHLDRHMTQTGCDGTPKNEFSCQVCAKVFSRKDNLREHLRAHAGQVKKKKTFVCEYCNKQFQGSALLTVHLRTHTGERPYSCDMCTKSFPSSGAMKKHRRMHTGERPYECSQCHNRFAAKETLNRHIRTHTGEKPHSCQFCGKTFIQAAQLRAHIFHHTGENAFTCPHCNRAFNRRARLTTHIKFIHEGAQPMQCPDCDKTFFRKEDLARHSLLHSGVKPYQCDVCKKSFAVKSSLKLHQLTHRKEQPCSCEECGRAFIRQDCLLRHMRARHRDVLEDIMATAEKKRLQQQLLNAVSAATSDDKSSLTENRIWSELTLTDSIKELLSLLVDDECLKAFGWPDAPVDKLLDAVIKRCGQKPASDEDFDYLGRMRENVKLLFTVVIDDAAVKSLLNNQTVDEVILHVLRLAKGE